MSKTEHNTLLWLIDNIAASPALRHYVQKELTVLRALTDIDDGVLPVHQAPAGIEVRAGELVHGHARAVYRYARQLKSGPRVDEHTGMLVFTDNRLVFSSPTKSHSLSFRRIIAHRGAERWMEVQMHGKPMFTYLLRDASPIPYAIFQTAVALAHQTKVVKSTGQSRHIPRDVRQRIWQRYAGRCADCGAGDYLEFDHIVPVAKGGSNSDANVQLLCRRCNLRKSDAI